MSKIVLSLWGPNLNMLGKRDPAKYGADTLDDHVTKARVLAESRGYVLEHLQTASEAETVAAIHGARERCAAIVINSGAFTHYAWSIHDALELFDGVSIEVHLSNPQARESWRHTSVIAPVVTGSITGFKGMGFQMAVEAAIDLASAR